MISYDLFRRGKTTSQIAQIRQLAISTIEGHLAFYILNGQIKVTELVSEQKISRIEEAIKKYGDIALLPLKQFLGEDVSYGEIRAVVNYLRWKKRG